MIPKEDAEMMSPNWKGEMLNDDLNVKKNKLTILELW
ncbi:hypothetical protein J2772_001207 [Chryseobacterium jejuense]|nr:hypothetical protein [Chryseobacterium jejuense]